MRKFKVDSRSKKTQLWTVKDQLGYFISILCWTVWTVIGVTEWPSTGCEGRVK